MGWAFSKLISQQQQQQQEVLGQVNQKKMEDQSVAMKIQAERIDNKLEQNISTFDAKQKKYEFKIEKTLSKAKELLEEGKQKQARKALEEVARLKKHIESIQTRRKVIENKKYEIEVQQVNKYTLDSVELANFLTKEDYSQKLQQHIMEAKEQKIISQGIDQKMKQLIQDDEQIQAADDLLAELQAEVSKEKRKNIVQKNVQVQISKNVETKKKQANKHEDIDAMVNSL